MSEDLRQKIEAARQIVAEAQKAQFEKRQELERAMADALRPFNQASREAEAALKVLELESQGALPVGTVVTWEEVREEGFGFKKQTTWLIKRGRIVEAQPWSKGVRYTILGFLKSGEEGTRTYEVEAQDGYRTRGLRAEVAE